MRDVNSPERRKRLAKRIRALRAQLRMVRSSARSLSAIVTLCGLKKPVPYYYNTKSLIAAADRHRTIDLSKPFEVKNDARRRKRT
jgi:hypothetical protein